MTTRVAFLVFCASLGACAPLPPAPTDPAAARPPFRSGAAAVNDYKRKVAHRIVQASAETYSAPLPEVMKSIVVLEITVDRAGQASAISVFRSNGYAHLEQRALASVAKAAPFAPPAPAVLGGAASVSFLETFLFREDDFFQLRSLVPNAKLF